MNKLFTEMLKGANPSKNYTRQGGNGQQIKWTVHLNNGKKVSVNADSKKTAKTSLSSSQLIIGVKKIEKAG
jgi:hypothetical protein